MKLFYTELAPWWPKISPLEHYQDEAQLYLEILTARRPSATTLLELGSGGGHNAFFLKQKYQLTLTDLSASMLDMSRAINPQCQHLQGDMRSLSLDREFDLVFIHDAIDYMVTEADLLAAFQTAYRHLRPGGLALVVPDHVREHYVACTEWGGSQGIRYLEWSTEVGPDQTSGVCHFAFLVEEADGSVRCLHEQHHFGLFSLDCWLARLTDCGFEVEVLEEPTEDERTPRLLFLASKPGPQL